MESSQILSELQITVYFPVLIGVLCDLRINFCQGVDCGRRGTCENLLTGYRCVCSQGYTGANCEVRPAIQISI